MKSREHRLTPEECHCNGFGTGTKFIFSPGESTMESFNLPTLDGLHLIPGLCEGVCLGAKALAGFPLWHN
ncbi:hypothetical protein BDR07DRAFT_1425395 [Suillus spraguei]|nr:hypothetical protein BDR07DRAFT_1425395 [Suillus spraguei]